MEYLYTYKYHSHKIIKREVVEKRQRRWLIADPDFGLRQIRIDRWWHDTNLDMLIAIIQKRATADYAKATRRMNNMKAWMDQQRKELA